MHTPLTPATDLEFLDETLDGLPGELLGLAALPVAHEAVHDAQTRVRRRRRRRTRQRGVHHARFCSEPRHNNK